MKKILFFSSVLFFLPKIFFGAVCSDQNLQTYLSQKKIDLKNDVLDSNFEIQLAPYLFYFALKKEDVRDKREYLKKLQASLEKKMHSDLSNKDQNKMSEALFWWIAASGELAASGDFISAWIKTSEIESRLQELKKINGAFKGAAADRGLAELYRIAPKFISVGSTEKTRFHLSEMIRIAPEHPANLINLAKSAVRDKKSELAKEYLNKLSIYLENNSNEKDLVEACEIENWKSSYLSIRKSLSDG